MKFMLLLAHDPGAWDSVTQADKERGLNGHMALIEQLTAQGKRIDSRRLRPTAQVPPFGDPEHSSVEVRPVWEREDY